MNEKWKFVIFVISLKTFFFRSLQTFGSDLYYPKLHYQKSYLIRVLKSPMEDNISSCNLILSQLFLTMADC